MADAKQEWQEVQEALRKRDAKAAAEAFRKYEQAKKLQGRPRSKPTLVNLSSRRLNYPNAVPVEKIPEQMEVNPEFFDLIRRVVTKEK